MSASDGSYPSRPFQCRDDVVFDLLTHVGRKHVVIAHDLLESSERMIREACPVQSVEIVRDVVVHGEK
jgi:hypothetical protein